MITYLEARRLGTEALKGGVYPDGGDGADVMMVVVIVVMETDKKTKVMLVLKSCCFCH